MSEAIRSNDALFARSQADTIRLAVWAEDDQYNQVQQR